MNTEINGLETNVHFDTCYECTLKHLGQAFVLIDEAENGYPLHKWIAIGHLAEAEREIYVKHPEIAEHIRETRKIYYQSDGKPDFFELFEMVANAIS